MEEINRCVVFNITKGDGEPFEETYYMTDNDNFEFSGFFDSNGQYKKIARVFNTTSEGSLLDFINGLVADKKIENFSNILSINITILDFEIIINNEDILNIESSWNQSAGTNVAINLKDSFRA